MGRESGFFFSKKLLPNISVTAVVLSITLQAVLSAHDDWIYSLEWHPNKLQLMSASNDKTVIIWEPSEIAAGLWLDKVWYFAGRKISAKF